mgnify:CR=1 FL=1
MNTQKWIDLNKIFISLPATSILALCAYGEARGEGPEGIKAVLNVMNNRVVHRGWFIEKEIAKLSSDYHGVILKPFQFSCFLPKDPNREKLLTMANSIINATADNSAFVLCLDLSVKMIQGVLEDNTLGALYYHTKQIHPKWADSFVKTVEIGNQIFYKEV